jgi:hypothetical protein
MMMSKHRATGRRAFTGALSRLLPVLAIALCLTLTACSPDGAAVGDTRTASTTLEHDGIDRNDVHIVVIGAGTASYDQSADLIAQLKESGIQTVFSAAAGIQDGVSLSVRSAVENGASLILIELGGVQVVPVHSLEGALDEARMAGVPVVISSARDVSIDTLLYAARFTSGKSHECLTAATQIMPLDTAVLNVIDDRVHPRLMCIASND